MIFADAQVGWWGLAAIICGTTVPSLVLAYRNKQTNDTKAKAQEALNTSKLVETAFGGLKTQADSASQAAATASAVAAASQLSNKRCEERCDELQAENASLSSEVKGLRTAVAKLTAKLEAAEAETSATRQELALLKGTP